MSRREGKQADALRLHADGKTVREIATALGLPPMTVQGWLPDAEDASQLARWTAMREQGLNNQEIGDREGVNRQRVAHVLGPVPRRKTGGRPRSIRIATESWEGVRAVAASLGLRTVQGVAEGEGSVGMLLDAIGAGEVEITWREGYGPHQPLGVRA